MRACKRQRVAVQKSSRNENIHLTTLRLRFAMVNPLRDVREFFFLADQYLRAAALARGLVEHRAACQADMLGGQLGQVNESTGLCR